MTRGGSLGQYLFCCPRGRGVAIVERLWGNVHIIRRGERLPDRVHKDRCKQLGIIPNWLKHGSPKMGFEVNVAFNTIGERDMDGITCEDLYFPHANDLRVLAIGYQFHKNYECR